MDETLISEAKIIRLQKEMVDMAKAGKNWRQIYRMALQKFNVKVKR